MNKFGQGNKVKVLTINPWLTQVRIYQQHRHNQSGLNIKKKIQRFIKFLLLYQIFETTELKTQSHRTLTPLVSYHTLAPPRHRRRESAKHQPAVCYS